VSRSGYIDDVEQWDLIRWRGAVASSIRGKRGQAFLLEMWKAMQALPEPKLIAKELEEDGAVCAIGSVGKARGVNMAEIDPQDHEQVADAFGIPHTLACEIMYMNDEGPGNWKATPEQRFAYMKKWIEGNLLPVEALPTPSPVEGEP
jgi:hypothetical protein